MTKENRLELLIWGIMTLPFIYLAAQWSQLPDVVPTHFNFKGEPDDYGSKYYLLGLVFFLTVPQHLLLKYIPTFDPRGKLAAMGSKYTMLRLGLMVLMSALAFFLVHTSAQDSRLDASLLIVLVGALYVVIGNYFPAMKPNYFIGIRTPWTLESAHVWKKTHQMAGKYWVIGGFVVILGALLPDNTASLIVLIATTVVITVVPSVYSYRELQRERNQGTGDMA